jgi:hypothetical protein
MRQAIGVVAGLALAVGLSVPSAAAERGDTAETMQALDDLDLLTAVEGPSRASGDISARTGLTITTETGTVSMQPDTGTPATLAEGGSVAVYASATFDYALTGEDAQADAGYVVIKEASAPNEYRFRMAADGRGAHLTLTDDGGVIVSNSQNQVVNALAPAWAVDAEGAPVRTWYSLDEDTVVQHVDHRGAAYPVVADPRLLCNGVFCTLMYNKSETQQVASKSGTAAALLGAGCGALAGPIGGLVCGFAASYAGQVAQDALNQGKCVGMRAFIYVPVSTTHLVIEPC